jgi:hypothetical protein
MNERLFESMLDIKGSYLYRAVGLLKLIKILEKQKIKKESSWTRDIRLKSIDGMESTYIAQISIIKDRYKAMGVTFSPIVGIEDYYEKSRLSYEAEERNKRDMPLYYRNIPMVAIELYDVMFDSPNYATLNKMFNDRWEIDNNIDLKKKKISTSYTHGEPLSNLLKDLEKYCKKYADLFVHNKTYELYASGDWREKFLANEPTFNKEYGDIIRNVNGLIANYSWGYYDNDDDYKALSDLLKKYSQRQIDKYNIELDKYSHDVITLEEMKYLYKYNPIFKALIIDSENFDLYKFFKISNSEQITKKENTDDYLELLSIIKRKLRYMPGKEEFQDIRYALSEGGIRELGYIKEQLKTNKKFIDWLFISKNSKLKKLIDKLLHDTSIKE